MFDAFSTPASVSAITLDAIRLATGLEWIPVDFSKPEIPPSPGVYVWVDTAAPHALRYHGSGSGRKGLQGRLSNQLRWRDGQRDRLKVDPQDLNEQEAYDLAREVPAVQQAAGDRQLFYAVAKPASWTVKGNGITPPSDARQWESFISAISLHVVGHRGLVGGGAWESKAGTINQLMTDLAWDRLVDINGDTWL